MNKTTVYISGPISKVPGGNKEAFAYAQKMLEDKGFEALNPHEIGKEINPKDYATDKDLWNAYMRACIKSMMDAEVIMMLPGFTNSDGAQMELEIAKRLDLKVLFFSEWHVKQTGLTYEPPQPTGR